MSSSRHRLYRKAVVIVAAGACLLLPIAARASQAAAGAPGQAQAQPALTGEYAGESTCITCHQDMGKTYRATAHGRAWEERTPAASHGCESCHGPGKAHADAGGDTTKIKSYKTMTPHDQSAMCTACHDRKTHALWDGSQHDQRNLSCATCHSIHNAKGEPQLKASDELALCATCHRDKTNRALRLNHMPLRERKLTCSSCHNVHGSTNVRLLKTGTTVDESCTSCHAEKRGPYLWEHAPVANACTTCHDPHGSNNDRMLVAKQPFLCQRCHVTSRHPPTVYDGFVLTRSTNANKIFGRSCVVCHQMIHGSNAPSGQAFLR